MWKPDKWLNSGRNKLVLYAVAVLLLCGVSASNVVSRGDVCGIADEARCLPFGLTVPLMILGAMVTFWIVFFGVGLMNSGETQWRGYRDTWWSWIIIVLGPLSAVGAGLLGVPIASFSMKASTNDLWHLVGYASGAVAGLLLFMAAWFFFWRYPVVIGRRVVIVRGRIYYPGETIKLRGWIPDPSYTIEEKIVVGTHGFEDGARWEFETEVVFDLDRARREGIREVPRWPVAGACEWVETEVDHWRMLGKPIEEAAHCLRAQEFRSADLPMTFTGHGRLVISQKVVFV